MVHVDAEEAVFAPVCAPRVAADPVPASIVTIFRRGKWQTVTHSKPVESTPQPTREMMWLLMNDHGMNCEKIPPV